MLCPNSHASCDLGFITLDDSALKWRGSHRVALSNLSYHNEELTRPGVR